MAKSEGNESAVPLQLMVVNNLKCRFTASVYHYHQCFRLAKSS